MPPLNWFENFIIGIALAHVGLAPDALHVLEQHDPGPFGSAVRKCREIGNAFIEREMKLVSISAAPSVDPTEIDIEITMPRRLAQSMGVAALAGNGAGLFGRQPRGKA
jgi:hypothetical protein